MKYCLNLGCWNSVFAVPTCVVDDHIKLAGAASLKVLLYMLRFSGSAIETTELSQKLSLNIEDVEDALKYWITCGVLMQDGEGFVPKTVENNGNVHVEDYKKEKKENEITKYKKKERISYNFDECAEIMAKDQSISEMLLAVETVLSKQLTHREMSLYVTLTHWYGFEPKLVPMLIHYCKLAGKPSASYIETTGLGWIEEGIDTIEKAEEKLRNKTKSRKAWKMVSDLLELDHPKPTASEEKFCTTWIDEWEMSLELINEAYERCVNKKGKLSFSYMNGIISRWYSEGVNTKEKLTEYDAGEEIKKSKKNTAGRFETTHDKNEIEQMFWDEMLDELPEDDT